MLAIILKWLTRLRLHLLPNGSRREALARRFYRHISNRPPTQVDFSREYQTWINANEPSAIELASQRAESEPFLYRPLISIITPVFNPPADVFSQTVLAVMDQTYPFWEWCIADGASTTPGISESLRKIASCDRRIQVTFLKENRGISGNSNAALQMAHGEFVLFLDHDDLLAPHALFEIVKYLQGNPETDYFYYDEDKVVGDSRQRIDPLFKPDWSPEMLLSANTLTHPTIRRSLINDIGPFDSGYDGTQDWDLAFRCTERTEKIAHIPKILYHWRQVPGSTAGEFTAKNYVFERQLMAVTEHLKRTGIQKPQATFRSMGIIQVKWPVDGGKVSIIIPTKDSPGMLRKCLSSLVEKTTYPNYEVVLVDNNSSDPDTLYYYHGLEDNPQIRIISFAEPFNYSKANNYGAKESSGEYLLFLNNDIEVLEPDWLEELARWAAKPGVGAVGAKLLYPDGKLQHAGVVLGLCGHADHIFAHAVEGYGGIFGSTDWYRNYTAVTGACLMISRTLFNRIGGFNENYRLVYNDIELCLRLREAGYRNIYTPFARLIHHEGGTRGKSMPVDDVRRAYERFKEYVVQGDPYFNPNLSYSQQIPCLKQPDEESRLDRLTRLTFGD